jgi:MFS family permease
LFAAAWGGAAGPHVSWMVVLGILLHGICYDFFFVTGFIYVDKRVPREIRGQAQGFLVLVTQGLGLGIGAQAVAALVTAHTGESGGVKVTDWGTVWWIPSLFALAVLIVFVGLFREGERGVRA